MNYKNLTIIGTSHISIHSINEIKKAFYEINPDFVALELDRSRALALLSKKPKSSTYLVIKKIGLKGYLFALIGGYIQKKLGQIVKVKPGSDMITALKLAKKNNKKVFLIDQDILITLNRFSKKIGWKEKFKLFFYTINAPFSRKKMRIDLTKVPEAELIEKILTELKKEFPNIYQVLVEERNQIMARNLVELIKNRPESRILAVVGAGHEADILKIIKSQLQ